MMFFLNILSLTISSVSDKIFNRFFNQCWVIVALNCKLSVYDLGTLYVRSTGSISLHSVLLTLILKWWFVENIALLIHSTQALLYLEYILLMYKTNALVVFFGTRSLHDKCKWQSLPCKKLHPLSLLTVTWCMDTYRFTDTSAVSCN